MFVYAALEKSHNFDFPFVDLSRTGVLVSFMSVIVHMSFFLRTLKVIKVVDDSFTVTHYFSLNLEMT